MSLFAHPLFVHGLSRCETCNAGTNINTLANIQP